MKTPQQAITDAIKRRWRLPDVNGLEQHARALFDIYEGVHGLVGDRPQDERSFISLPRGTLGGESIRGLIERGSASSLSLALRLVDRLSGR